MIQNQDNRIGESINENKKITEGTYRKIGKRMGNWKDRYRDIESMKYGQRFL